MSIVSPAFLAFSVLALLLYHGSPRRRRMLVLLALSLAFYGFSFPAYGVLLVLVSVAVWWAGLRMSRSVVPRRWLAWSITGIVVLLAGFKYVGMILGTVDGLLKAAGLPTVAVPQIVAPLGISFISFGLIHYLVSVYRHEAEPAGPLEVMTFASFFPTVTSGPIKRYPAFLDELRRGGDPVATGDVAYAVGRIVSGLAKKVVLADVLFTATTALRLHGAGPLLNLVVAIYAYTLYIYFDFSGYSDIVIGVSRLFGFKIIENFDWPYLRRNLADFWSAWHMSLTRFITEYVFIPLGGSRVGRWKTARNVLVAMAVSGLWHGAAWNYVAWGLFHGIGLVLVRWWREATGAFKSRHEWFASATARQPFKALLHVGGIVVTFNYVALGWVLFALPLPDAIAVFGRLAKPFLGLLRLG